MGIPSQNLPGGVAFGMELVIITLNALIHIRYLYQNLTQEYGVRVLRSSLDLPFATQLSHCHNGDIQRCISPNEIQKNLYSDHLLLPD